MPGKWNKRESTRCLWLSLIAITLVGCGILVYISLLFDGRQGNEDILKAQNIRSEKLTGETCVPVCDTKECILHADALLTSINERVDPCDNFNTFLCGDFEEKFGPGDKEGTIVHGATLKMFKNLKGMLDRIEAEASSASGKMKILYDSCMEYSSELQGLSTALQVFNDIGIENWPKLDDFKLMEYNLSTVLGKLKTYLEFNSLIFAPTSGNTSAEQKTDKKVIIVKFYPDSLKHSSEFPKEAGVDILKYFDLGIDEINHILEDHETVRDSILNLTIVKEGIDCEEEDCPEIYVNCLNETDSTWVFLCDAVKAFISAADLNDAISDEFILIDFEHAQFLQKFVPLLETLTRRSVANFWVMNFLWKYLGELNFYFRFTKQKYFEDKPNEQVFIDKWKYCVDFISRNMILALDHEYFQHHLTKPSIQEIFDVYQETTSVMGDIVAQQEWIPSPAKSFLADQIRHMSSHLFILSNMLPNETFVNEQFKMFHPVPGNFFQNVLRLKRAALSHYYVGTISPETLYLVMLLNEILFKVQASTGGDTIDMHFGMLVPPFYTYGLNRQMNLASLAPTLGHELGHVLSVFLVEIFKGGHDDAHRTFREKKYCIENQFSNFKFDLLGENLNGTQYLEENLADNLAITLLDKLIGKSDSSPDNVLLPGLPYSTKQIYYMKANQMWCAKYSRKQEIVIKTDVHAPQGSRLIGSMQNSRGFSETFQCPDGSYMNPTIKCSFLD